MFKIAYSLLATLTVIFLFGNSLLAQVQKQQVEPDKKQINKMQFEEFFASANESAIIDNGKVSYLKLPIQNEGEKLFSFVHAEDGKSFIMTDEKGLRFEVLLYEDRRIQSVVMPNGKKVDIKWVQKSDGNWIAKNEKFNCGDNVGDSNPCRDAAVASSIALFVCAGTGGLSIPCIGATANAAYHTYRCYESMENVLYNTGETISYARRFNFIERNSRGKGISKNSFLFNN